MMGIDRAAVMRGGNQGGWRTDELDLPASREALAELLLEVVAAVDLASVTADGATRKVTVTWRPSSLQPTLLGGRPNPVERTYQAPMTDAAEGVTLLGAFAHVDELRRVVSYIVVHSYDELALLLHEVGVKPPAVQLATTGGEPETFRVLGADVVVDATIPAGSVLLYHSKVRTRPEWCDILRIAVMPYLADQGGTDE